MSRELNLNVIFYWHFSQLLFILCITIHLPFEWEKKTSRKMFRDNSTEKKHHFWRRFRQISAPPKTWENFGCFAYWPNSLEFRMWSFHKITYHCEINFNTFFVSILIDCQFLWNRFVCIDLCQIMSENMTSILFCYNKRIKTVNGQTESFVHHKIIRFCCCVKWNET